MNVQTIAHIRNLLARGLTDAAIEEALYDSQVAADDHAALYGDQHEERDGPVHLHCDGRYSRNDAGEWIGLM